MLINGMHSRHIFGRFLSLGLIAAVADVAIGQIYPHKPIRIVTNVAGSGSDFTSRLIAQGLAARLGQPVIVDNRVSGLISETVAKAPPDGYTLLINGSSVWVLPLLRDKVPYDAQKDLAPVTLTDKQPIVLVLHPLVPVRSVEELIALARAKPGHLNYASTATGSPNHLAAELFKSMTGTNMVRITYKGSGPALNDLIGGQVQLTFGTSASVIPHVKSGRLKALAVTSAQPSELLPGLPTISASGVPGYEAGTIYGVLAPAKTPAALINRLNQEIVLVLSDADVKAKFFNVGVETVGSTPQQFAAYIKSDIARMGKVIRDAGIKAD